jgi:hypothetical protein
MHGHAEREHHHHEALELHESEDVGVDNGPKHDLEDHDRHVEPEWNLGQRRRRDGSDEQAEYGRTDQHELPHPSSNVVARRAGRDRRKNSPRSPP